MPDYVYRCQECGRRSRHFYTYADYERAQPVCPHCQSRQLRRVIGRVAVARTEDSRLDALADDDMMAGLDSEDPRALGRFMRQMSSEMGEDLGDEFHEVVDRLERGESPESIEESMPDLGEDAGSAFGGDDLDF